MRQETRYLISDAAKKVAVESHVLRYWEEELKLPIKRNELGHRYYTEEDILRFQEVKALKEQGLQLKAIRMILKDGRLEPFAGKEIAAKAELREKEPKHVIMVNSNEIMSVQNSEPAVSESKEAKSLRLQQLLQQMISEAVRTNNRELCDDIKETMLKELDYQFRLQEEREEAYMQEKLSRDDQHYQRVDELLRNRNKKARRKEVKQKEITRKEVRQKPQKPQKPEKPEKEEKGGLFKKK